MGSERTQRDGISHGNARGPRHADDDESPDPLALVGNERVDSQNDSGGSERQFGDALRVYEIQFAKLDFAYMEDWAVRVGVADLWERLKREARPLP